MNRIPARDDGQSISQWDSSSYAFNFERTVTAIDGNSIKLDAPLPQRFEKQYGGGHVVKYSWPDRLRNIGIENLRLVSDYVAGEESSDEDHARNGVVIDSAENGWVRNIVAKHFLYSAVTIDRNARFFTVQDSLCLDAVSRVTGGRRYSFYLIGQRNLVQRCATRDGRHDYITGSRVCGPNVFVDCLAIKTNNDIGPHHRWAMGILWDNIHGGEIRIRNRANRGTGHGWAGAQNVLWNSTGSLFVIQSPPTSWNLAIGNTGARSENEYEGEDGIYDSHSTPVAPRSLFIQQLTDRVGSQKANAIVSVEQRNGQIIDMLSEKLNKEKEGRDASL